MRPFCKMLSVLGLVALGYALGASGTLAPRTLEAQGAAEAGPSEDARKKLADAFNALKAAAEPLEQENLYASATTGMNVFAVAAGGLNCINDLEEGRGVDPETYAALFAGEGKPEIKEHIDFDDQNRMTYKGKVVRLYPKYRMKKIYQDRLKFAGIKK